ncbi:aminopeptidase P family protein [Natronolimnobius sp. AArcel1]|uniref:M24 family metallopeptidase n=1 Tax=Natronolimnobius sp. AArcel1 TaxID=1679093 RepID=UPI0013EB7DBE|nr:Xaa-Pro peptidase family protein [Natronolimnobius sp. AArcel1]NGM71523.1 aminopeptidase P family protein [Natronolimnobius sp. AArcel1]
MDSPFEQRLAACQSRLEDDATPLAICAPGPNLTYLTGFDESPSERHFLLFVPHASVDAPPTFVAPAMYESQLEEGAIADIAVRLWDDADDPVAVIERTLESFDLDLDAETGQPSVLVDDRMWATFVQDLQACCPSAEFGLVSDVLEPIRIRKDETELAALRRAGDLADRVSREIRSRGEALCGLTERELAAEIERLLIEYGGRDLAFETIVAAGPNGARPHHHSSDRPIQRGDPIVMDFGAFVETDLPGDTQYPGDQTRTMVVGDPPEAYEEVHEIVAEAQQAAVEAVEPGVTAGDIDAVAREHITNAGYGDAFVHRTGHGVGLEVHEPPYIVADNDRELEAGMVFSIEPGIYLEDRFGVRIEDLVIVTDGGAERLNNSPRGWETGEQRDQ